MIKGYSAISTSLWHHVASSKHWKGYHEAFPVVNINQRSKLGIRSNLFTTPFLREGHVLVWTTVGGELGYVLMLKLFSPLFMNQKTWRSNLTSDMSLGHQNYSKFWISEVVLCQQWGRQRERPMQSKHLQFSGTVFILPLVSAVSWRMCKMLRTAEVVTFVVMQRDIRGFEIAWKNLGQ